HRIAGIRESFDPGNFVCAPLLVTQQPEPRHDILIRISGHGKPTKAVHEQTTSDFGIRCANCLRKFWIRSVQVAQLRTFHCHDAAVPSALAGLTTPATLRATSSI